MPGTCPVFGLFPGMSGVEAVQAIKELLYFLSIMNLRD